MALKCPGLEVTVFGREGDLRAMADREPPEAIVAQGPVLGLFPHYRPRMQGTRNGAATDNYVLLSIDKPIDPAAIAAYDMDAERRPWVRADSANPEGTLLSAALEDSASLWASGARAPVHRRLRTGGGPDVIEFASPAEADGRTLGVIRYGLTPAGMDAAIASASRSAPQALVLFGFLALFGFGLVARGQAAASPGPA